MKTIKSDYRASVLKKPRCLRQIHWLCKYKTVETSLLWVMYTFQYIVFFLFPCQYLLIHVRGYETLKQIWDSKQLWLVTGPMAPLNVGHHEFFVKWMQMMPIPFETAASKSHLILGHMFSVTWLCVCVCSCISLPFQLVCEWALK